MLMQHTFTSQLIPSADGTSIYSEYLPAVGEQGKAQGTLIWIHGAFEHCQRYHETMQFFAQHGYASIGFDLRGHGQSGGKRVFIRSIREYFQDLTAVHQHYKDQLTARVYIVGHSMGGLVAIRFLQEFSSTVPIKAAILSAPFLGEKVRVPGYKKTLSKLVNTFYPALAVDNGIPARLLSHDKQAVERYMKDPLVTKQATVSWYEEIQDQHELALVYARHITRPLHFMLAGDDKIVDNGAVYKLCNRLDKNLMKTMHVFEGFYHELFQEEQKEEVRNYMLKVLE
jgi:lysophospholipase